MEKIFSGYCRTADSARMVLLDLDETPFDADCDYACCAYREECEIGKQITALTQKGGSHT